MSDRIWIWFADNGNIRKWQHEPFPEGTEYVVAAQGDAELEEMTRSCLAERAGATSLRSKLEEAEGAQGWQPIETAPKDGTPVLAYRSPSTYGTRSPLVFVAWHDESQAWIWPDDTYDPYVRDSYDDAFNEGSEFADTSFSHWMPIPSQPALASLREADHA